MENSKYEVNDLIKCLKVIISAIETLCITYSFRHGINYKPNIIKKIYDAGVNEDLIKMLKD